MAVDREGRIRQQAIRLAGLGVENNRAHGALIDRLAFSHAPW